MRRISGHYTDGFGKQRDFDVFIPGDWSELSPQQYANILKLLTYEKSDRHVMATSLLATLFGPANWHILNFLPDDDLHTLVQLTNFVLETAPPAQNKFPLLKIRKKVCHAPEDDLSNIGFAEWCFAYQFYTDYIKTGDIGFLNKLIATLYRPADPNQKPGNVDYAGDIRIRFNENLINDSARSLEATEDRIKLAILCWLRSTFSSIQEIRPHAFPVNTGSDGAVITPDKDNEARTWFTVFRELLGEKWGTVEKLKFTNALFVLDYLEEQQIEFKRASAANQS